MAVDERRRVRLFERLVEALGEEAASTMLDLLPPPGRDVATSDDIARLEQKMDMRFAVVDERFDALEQRFASVEQRLEQRMDERFAAAAERLEALEQRLSATFERRIGDAITAQTRTIIFGLLGALVVLGGYALSLARLVG